MKRKSLLPIALACAFCALPLSACGAGDYNENTLVEERLPVPSEAPPQITLPAEDPIEEPPAAPQEPQEPPEPNGPTPAPSVPTVVPQPQPQPEPKPQTVQYLLVKTDGLNIRTGAGTSYSVLGKADGGSLLVFTEKTGEWYKTRYKDRTAYVSASHVSLYTVPAASDDTENVIKRGFDLLGVKYVFGATRCHDGKGNKLSGFTTTAFDCSSYMQYIFLHGAGVLLNVTTRTQVTQGRAVAASNLKRGDLMFFTNASRANNTGVERVGHVALYLGDDYILHTASDYARAEKLTAARWNYYITARRV